MASRRPLAGADSRPRIHLWPQPDGSYRWSEGPTGRLERAQTGSAGLALHDALAAMPDDSLRDGAVIILEPRP